MRSLIRLTMLSGAGALAAILAVSAANAAVTISSAATANMSCVSGVCTPTTVKFHSLYAFQVGIDGVRPYAGLVFDKAGNLYGTASSGKAAGAKCDLQYGCGSVFVVTPSGKEKVLHAFESKSGDGSLPLGGLITDAAGNLYGTTGGGGAFEYGTVFEMTPKGKETILYSLRRSQQ